MTDFTTIPHGLLVEGDETPLGVIEAVSYTAYLIDGTWVPFEKVHGPRKPSTPLIEWVDSLPRS